MTTYLLDANVFISAKRSHYRLETFPSFWKLLHGCGTKSDRILTLEAVRDEMQQQQDDLSAWVKTCPIDLFASEKDASTAAAAVKVSAWTMNNPVYSAAARADFFSAADYWLVAHASAHGFRLVTHETPDPLCKRRVKIPDACTGVGVSWTSPWQMLEDIGVAF